MARVDLPPLVRDLLRPAAYPHPVDRVRLVQTHISYVFLAGDHVYKVKKPVNFGFLDFSTLGKRRYYCHQEVRLNSRLCAGTYLGVSRVSRRGGRFVLDGRGPAVEYAVHMRRLPAERMMHTLLAAGQVSEAMVGALAERLAAFHAAAATSRRIAEYGDWAVRYAWDENFRQWRPYLGETITPAHDRILRAYGEAFFARRRDVLRRRIEELRIRDCHGDLRCDAVCFSDGLCIYDCIDFNRRLRYTDVAGDVGFLAMDLDYRGRADLAQAFVRSYLEASGDADLAAVVDFYRCYRACVRGKVESFRLGEPEVSPRDHRSARRAARRYFRLACRYAASLPPALLIITCGLPATGKSTLARRLAEASGAEVVSSDVLRKELAGIAPTERRFEPFGGGIYSAAFSDRTYAALSEAARSPLRVGRSVILDASFVRRKHRRQAARVAREEGAQFVCVESQAGPEVVRRRLARRLREGGDPSDARWEIYAAQKRIFQRPTEVDPERHVVVDSALSLRAQVRGVMRALRTLSPLSLARRLSSR